jgi:hypothetical protein
MLPPRPARTENPNIDPKDIPTEVAPGVRPEPSSDKLLAAAQTKAPNLTPEFIDKHNLTDDDLAAIARGEEPPPPVPGDSDLYRTPGGWQSVPKGVKPQDVGKHAISRLAGPGGAGPAQESLASTQGTDVDCSRRRVDVMASEVCRRCPWVGAATHEVGSR